MIKTFCDICEKEIKHNYVTTRLKGKGWHKDRAFMLEVILGDQNGCWNRGFLCLTCLRHIFLDLVETQVANVGAQDD